MEKVIKTRNGLFIRIHNGFGAIVFSPFSGLFFAIKEAYTNETLAFCNGDNGSINPQIKKHLEIGLNNSIEQFPISHYLPSSEPFLKSNELPPSPIVINWLISNRCNCRCVYCYADDVIDNQFDNSSINETAKKILELNPLAVVISGGEPLLEIEKLKLAVQLLGDKVGIILDTNGLIWDEEVVQLLKEFNAVVRVSLDDIREQTNSKVRIVRDKKIYQQPVSVTINNIVKYRKKGIPVLIHSVITSHNKNSLFNLATKLPELGVNGWRLFFLIKPNNKEISIFNKAMNYRNDGNYEDQVEDIKRKISLFKRKNKSTSKFSIEVIPTNDSNKNSVVLVLPDGKIATELLFEQQKSEIQTRSLFNSVNLWGHYERYLGKI